LSAAKNQFTAPLARTISAGSGGVRPAVDHRQGIIVKVLDLGPRLEQTPRAGNGRRR
jgi:hypothetical protein